MSLTKIDKKIAEAIILAQVASDGGKNIPDIKNILDNSASVWKKGYLEKDKYILKAINLIDMSRNSRFRYYVKEGDIPHSALVYFNYKNAQGKRELQISFHTFSKKIKKWISKRENPVYVTTWDEGSSRLNCMKLKEIMLEALMYLFEDYRKHLFHPIIEYSFNPYLFTKEQLYI